MRKQRKLIKRAGKVHSLYGQIIEKKNIQEAWEKVKKNGSSPN